MQITPDIANTLKCYVYVYTDPRSGKPFYIGKGQGNRVFAHLDDTAELPKTAIIREIRESGEEPEIDILRYGLSEAEASLVEASAIDLVGLQNLTNRVAGHHDDSFGRIGSKELIQMLQAKPTTVRHKALLITINRLYRSNMSKEELYEATKLLFEPGDIIFGRRRAYQRKLGVAEWRGIASAHSLVLRAKPDVVLPEFLPFFMQSDLFMDRAQRISVGSLSPTINSALCRKPAKRALMGSMVMSWEAARLATGRRRSGPASASQIGLRCP